LISMQSRQEARLELICMQQHAMLPKSINGINPAATWLQCAPGHSTVRTGSTEQQGDEAITSVLQRPTSAGQLIGTVCTPNPNQEMSAC
jgi:hypothetical protein